MIFFLFYFFITVLGIKQIYINQDYLKNGKLYELDDSEYLVIQEIQNGTMQFKITQADTQKYIQIELIFLTPEDGYVNLQFTISQNSLPSMEENKTLSGKYTDINGDNLHKSYQNILIPANSYQQGDIFYITNFKREQGKTYKYYLRINRMDNIPCPNNCASASFGYCNLGICACEVNRIDLDCSKIAKPILIDNKMENISISGTQYFYFQQITQLETIQLDLEISNILQSEYSQIFVYLMFENFYHGVATQEFNNYTFSFSEDSKSISQIIDVSLLNNNPNLYRFNRLLLTFVVPDTCEFNINISVPSIDSEDKINLILMGTLIPFISIIILALILYQIYKYKKTNRVGIKEPKDEPYIILEKFDSYLIKILWSKLNKHPMIIEKNIDYKKLDSCNICLGDFVKDSICRVTPCIHVFHADCLQEWVVDKQHESCPNCRELLNEKSLKKHAMEMQKYNQNQQLKKKDKKNPNSLMIIQNEMQSLPQMIQN